jgi:two-component system, LytTR family, response regulator LytT
MQIVIIEDEKLTANDLAETLKQVVPEARIVAMLTSVSSAIGWFQQNEHPDLIFSDIQLGDGLSFEIFKVIDTNTPVIFCTAFDEYALRAFDANGIDYILKPFDQVAIEVAIQKYHKLKSKFSANSANMEQLIQWMSQKKRPSQGSVLVYKQDKILPIRFNDIALFYIENEITHLVTFDQKSYTVNKTIEAIEEIASDEFFRVNRQYLVHRRAIKEASHYFARKLSLSLCIPFQETIAVSKNKVTDFLTWLSTK